MIFYEIVTISELAKVVRYNQFTFSCEFEFSKLLRKEVGNLPQLQNLL